MSLTEVATEAAAFVPRVSLTELERVESKVEVDHQHCLVCYSDLTHPGILPCNHNEICGICHLRLRHLHGNKKCPICKQEHEKIVADVPGKVFDEYPIWGDELGSNYVFKEKVGMFFPLEYYANEIDPLFGYQCTEPSCTYDGTVLDPNNAEHVQEEAGAQSSGNNKRQKNKKPPTPLRALQDHLRVNHRLTLCQLCIDHKRDFVASLPRMAPYQLKKHLTKGDGPGSGFEGHPVCEFCRPKRFYDLTHLHMHLQKEHYKCHVCEKQGQSNQYFRNYQSLAKHFDRAHFVCHDAQCLAARFVVFENDIDLHAHERQVHGGTTSGSSKIQLEFQTRRTGYDGAGVEQQRQETPSEEDFNYGLHGEAFVPAALPQTDDLTLHPMHLRRTAELRAQAAQIREQQQLQNQGASFPTLQAATTGNETDAGAGQQPLNIGWTAGTTVTRVAGNRKPAGVVTESDFPALAPAGPRKSAASAKMRVGANRQFAAMRATAAQPVTGSGWGGSAPAAAAAPASSYQYNSTAFPPGPAFAAPANRQQNLAPDNFPTLGGGTKKAPRYAPPISVANRLQSPAQRQLPSWNSAIDFPGPSVAPKRANAPAQVAPAPRQHAPSLNSEMDFPAPPSANSSFKAMKQKVVKSQTQPSQAAVANVLRPPQTSVLSTASPKDTLQDMQASLGPAKYKKLKKFTREFAEDNVAPDTYVDNAAALFDKGYEDPDFWKSIPLLVSSCPNQGSANKALHYMESLRTMKAPAVARMLTAPPAPTGNSWGSSPLDLKPESFPTPPVAATRQGGAQPIHAVAAGRIAPVTRYVVPVGKKKGAWGGTSPTAVVQAKKTPASVASAAANQGPQGGSATRFMAKQTKQQAQQQQPKINQNAQSKKKKKKEKDELRNLAFGR